MALCGILARQFLSNSLTRSVSSQVSFIGLRAVAVFSDGSGFGFNSKGDLVLVKQSKGESTDGSQLSDSLLYERAENDVAEPTLSSLPLQRVVDSDMWIEPTNRGITPWMKPLSPRRGASNFSTWVTGGKHSNSSSEWLKPVKKTSFQYPCSFSSLAGDGSSSGSSVNFPMSLVIFDKDGTLIDCNSVWLPWMEAHVKELEERTGMKLSKEMYSAVGYCPEEKEYQDDGLLAHATVAEIKEKFIEVLVENGMDHCDATEMVDGCCPDFDSGDEDTLTPLGDLPKIFETLQTNGVKTAVCTMDSRDGTMTALNRLGVTSMIDMIVCGDDHHSKPKPAPDNALNICKTLQVCPTKTVVVGDTTADTGMGKSAGLGLTVGVLSGAGSRGALEKQSDIVLNSVDEFLDTLFKENSE